MEGSESKSSKIKDHISYIRRVIKKYIAMRDLKKRAAMKRRSEEHENRYSEYRFKFYI